MLNLVITGMESEISAAVMGCSDIEEARKAIDDASGGAERVVAFLQFDTKDSSALMAIYSLCCINSEEDESFCQELEKILTEVFNAGRKYGMNAL